MPSKRRSPNRAVTPPRILTHEEQLLTTLILETRELRKELTQKAKESESQRRTAITLIHNLQVEVAELRNGILKLAKLCLDLQPSGPTESEAQAILRDYFITQKKHRES